MKVVSKRDGLYRCVACGALSPDQARPWLGRCQCYGPEEGRPLDLTPAPTSGPGTELKKLLKKVGITATPTCSCNARARTMDINGCDWVEANEATVVGWLREEATKRGLPFLDAAGRVLVKRAISNARKAEARRAKEAQPAESGPA